MNDQRQPPPIETPSSLYICWTAIWAFWRSSPYFASMERASGARRDILSMLFLLLMLIGSKTSLTISENKISATP